MSFKRKTPEELLHSISRLNRGKLKIWIGAMTGTGKTYRMLREGHSLKEQGVDVVICAVSTLGRPETVKQLGDLERVPSIHWDKDGKECKDLNIAALLERNPEIVLVDELAHRNRPDAMFPTRLDDIKYLLEHGISIITTINIYELEDVHEQVYKRTGILASETVPTDTLELADEVQLIDVSPETILQRLEEGIIGSGSRREDRALFQRGNLAVLRELTLRLVAEDVNETLEQHRKEQGLVGASGVTEIVLVLAQYHWNGSILLRRGQQIARRLNGELLSVTFVKKGAKLTKEQLSFRKSINKLTEKMGVKHYEIHKGTNRSLSEILVKFANQLGVTRIVLGHSKKNKWEERLYGSIPMGLLKCKPKMDLFFVADRAEHEGERIMPAKRIEQKESQFRRLSKTEVAEQIQAIRRGRLRVYVGAAPGVGKTYTMLREGNELLRKGIDVVVGLLETHGREETAAQLGELLVIPRLRVAYKGVSLEEMDTDAIISRNPEVVLVDELAHTNVPGTANKKRYEDVQRLLNEGISVMTTVNVQHLESLNDKVEQLTGVRVRETVPDWLLQQADEVELIDVAPQMLQQRMQQGKIYDKAKVEQALGAFFKLGNLIALRELALREIADDVDERLEAWDRRSALRGQLKRKEVILVCVADGEKDHRLVRRGFRIAHRLKADWHVVHVANKKTGHDASKSHLDSIRIMTERFGGQFEMIRTEEGQGIADTLLAYAFSIQTTQIIIGQFNISSKGLGSWFWSDSNSIIKQLLREGRKMDLLVVSED